MKKVLLILVSVMIAEIALGQIQYGYVRTIGRSNRPGAGIDSVLIKIKDCTRVKSHSMGNFSVELPNYKEGQGYKLENVIKAGYELKNKGDLKEYAYSSSVPLTIDMYSVKEKNNEEKEIYNRMYEEVSNKYKKMREKLIEQLENSQSDNIHIKKELDEIKQKFESIPCLLEKIANRCAMIDYDKITSYEKELQMCIESGNISEAVKLINAEGGINKIIEDAKQTQQEAALAKEISYQKDKEANQKKEKAITSLYAMYIEALSNFDYPVATSYMIQIADLDTCNFENQIIATEYTAILGDFTNSFKYCNRALSIAYRTDIQEQIAMAKDKMGDFYLWNKDFDSAYSYYQDAIWDAIFSNSDTIYVGKGNNENSLTYSDSLLISSLFLKLSIVEAAKGNIDNAEGHMIMSSVYKPKESENENNLNYLLQQALFISAAMLQAGQWQACYDILHPIATIIEEQNIDDPARKLISMTIYAMLSQAETNIIKEIPKSKKHIDMALKNLEEIPFTNNEIRTGIYIAAANAYQANHEYEKAFEFIDSARVAYNNSFKQDTLTMCRLLNDTGQLYWRKRNWDKAIECFQDALALGYDADNDKSPITSMLLYNIGQNLKEKLLLDSALAYHYKALEMRERTSENTNIDVYTLSESYIGIAQLYYMKKEYVKAADFYEKAYMVNRKIYNTNAKEVYGMKRNQYYVLYNGKKNEIENRELEKRFDAFLQSHAFVLINTNDSIDMGQNYLLSVDNWNITNNTNDAIEIYNKCKDKNSIVVAQKGKIVHGQALNVVDYVIEILPIDKKDKTKLLKLYNKNKKEFSKFVNAKK